MPDRDRGGPTVYLPSWCVAGLDDLYDIDDDLIYAWLQPGMQKASTSAAIADEAFAGP